MCGLYPPISVLNGGSVATTVVASSNLGWVGAKKPPPHQHGGDMLIKATVRHLIPIKGRAGVDVFTILLNKRQNIKK